MISKNPADSVRTSAALGNILRHLPVLTYHKVEVRREVGINVVSPAKFRQHLSFLRRAGYQSVTFRDLLTEPNLPAKPVILTFDDAYESIYSDAFPIMQEFGFKGVVFVISGFIGRRNTWDINLGGIHFRHMSEEQLRKIERAGWEIGSHGVTHRAFTFLHRDQLEREIHRSRQILKEINSMPPVSIAYPFGIYNDRVCQAVKKGGFVFGCKSIRGTKNFHDLLQLRRMPVYQFDGLQALGRKIDFKRVSYYEKIKLSMLSWPAVLTPLYQAIFKRELFLEK
jgi:peptidoglycan/xylan/chitin deacetylase (PgdA/CDA1 family)